MTTNKTWDEQLKAERLAAARKQGREDAKMADKNFEHGHISGICVAASFFIGKGRLDISQALLNHFYITEEKAEAALQTDKRTSNMTLQYLRKSGVWSKPYFKIPEAL